MQDKPISVRLGVRRAAALERYLEANPGETRNGVIAGALELYLKQTGFWEDTGPSASGAAGMDEGLRPTLSERVARLEDLVAKLQEQG